MARTFAEEAPCYHAAGLNVLPIVPGVKWPPEGLSWRQWQSRRQSEAEMGRLVETYPTADIALVMGGPGDLVDVETDGIHGERALRELGLPVPGTACFASPRGAHRLYRAPRPMPSHLGLRPGLDVLGARRYVLVPNSTGRVWQTLGGLDAVVLLPEAWVKLLLRDGPSPSDALPVTEYGVEEGRRNTTLARLVGRWITQGLAEAEVIRLAHRFAQRCRPPLDTREAETVAASVLRTRHRGRSPERVAALAGRTARLSPTDRWILVALEVHRGELGVRAGEPFAAPVRAVASITGYNPSTVARAYGRMCAAGLLRVGEDRDPVGRPATLVTVALTSPLPRTT